MENKLQELTRKIYSEGVEKASQEAAVILENARKQAEEITLKAQRDADAILNSAKQTAADLQRNTESEVRMSSKQAISALRQQITSMITAQVTEAPVKEAISDKEFVGSLISKAIENFGGNAALVLPKADESSLEKYFGSRISAILGKGVSVSFDEKIKGGFKIGPADNSYVISFTDEDFQAFFRSFMRQRTINLLFGSE